MRKWGKHVDINIGLSNLRKVKKTEGHCWLTLPNGSLFLEEEDPCIKYSVFLGESKNGIRYWVAQIASEEN